jgi:PAS domain S-box-containing protein
MAVTDSAKVNIDYGAMVESAGLGLTQCTADGRLQTVNENLARLCGYGSPAEMLAAITDLDTQFYALPHQRAEILTVLKAQEAHPFEIQAKRKDGTVVWLREYARVLRAANGEPDGYQSLFQDITQRQHIQTQMERAARQLTSLSQLGQTVAASLDQTVVLNRVLDEVSTLLDADGTAVFLLESQQLTLEAVGGAATVSLIGRKMARTDGVAGQIMTHGRPIVLGDINAQNQIHRSLEQFTVEPVQSLIAVPLQLQGQVIGVIEAVHEDAHRFTAEDAQLLEAVASWAAIAIGNARQHTRIQRRLQESEAMGVISQALNETHDLDEVLQMIVDAARQIIPRVERSVIHLLDEDKQVLRSAAYSSESELGRSDLAMRPGEGVAGRVMAEGQPINVSDTHTDPRYLIHGPLPSLRSLLVAPVQSGDRRLGTISVQSREPHAFSSDDEMLLKTLGLQAALAIENARLLEVEHGARRDAEVLSEIASHLSSTLNFEELLDLLLEQVSRLVPYDAAALLLVDHNLGRTHTARLRGYEKLGEPAVKAVSELQLEVAHTPHLRHMAMIAQPVAVPDVKADPAWKPWPAFAQANSWIGAPVHVQGEGVVAFFSLEKSEPGFYTNEFVYKLGAFCGQAALAIQNARLYADLETSLRHEKTMRAQMVQGEKLAAMGRLVASVAHELNNPLQAIQNSLYLVSQESDLSPQSREDLQVSLAEADRMADLISRLRETYRPATAEQFQLESLNAIIEEVQKLIATHLRRSNVTCNFLADMRVPRVPSLRDQLKQVILNLSLNAVEAMSKGGRLTIQTQNMPQSNEVLVSISDTGAGIEPNDLRRIFDPFFTRKEGGTGLGLFITHEIVQRHQGRIDVESTPGKGSTFKVWLPITRTEIPGREDIFGPDKL